MKALLLILISFASFTAMAVNDGQIVNEKILRTFKSVFQDASDVKWNTVDNYSDASFELNDIKVRARLDMEGNLIQTMRYYKENNLPYIILYHVKKKYKNQEIFGITEVSNKNGISYNIVLKDEKNWYYVNADEQGWLSLMKKMKRGDI